MAMNNARQLFLRIPRAHHGVCMGLAVGGGAFLVGSATGVVQLSEISLQFQPTGNQLTVGATVGLNCQEAQSGAVNKNPITFVMIGMTGHGKSQSGNTLVGKTVFGVSNSSKSVTKEVASHPFSFGGVEYLAIDLPGFEDTSQSLDDIQKQLALVAHHAKGHVHALVIVHRRGRATKEVQKVIDYVVQQFGQTALLKYGIIVLTDTTESGDDIRLDVRDLPAGNSYRKLVLSLSSGRVMTLQNAFFFEFFKRWQQRQMILQQIHELYKVNESSIPERSSAHLDCEVFRKKRLEDEELRLKEKNKQLEDRSKQLEDRGKQLEVRVRELESRPPTVVERIKEVPKYIYQGGSAANHQKSSGCSIS